MTNYTSLSVDLVYFVHVKIIEDAGGKQGIRDFALLHSALERCKASFGGQDLYPRILEKGAALWHSLTMNHPFLDGNKRTAFAILWRFLEDNGVLIQASQQEIVDICISIDNDHLELSQIVAWLESHTSQRK